MEYTKGEWNTFIPEGSNGYWKVVADGKEIAILYQTVSSIELEANAHLISSAPLMYEALKQCTRYLGMHTIARTGDFALQVAKEALAKAEGK